MILLLLSCAHMRFAPARTLSWLEGCWTDGQYTETWTRDGGDLVGTGAWPDGTTEDLRITLERDGPLHYIATPSNQPTATFSTLEWEQWGVVFTNPDHDWPQAIEYRMTSYGVYVLVSGGDRSFELSLRPCDGG